jgi:hypoxanthine phosphoribosyltransferase
LSLEPRKNFIDQFFPLGGRKFYREQNITMESNWVEPSIAVKRVLFTEDKIQSRVAELAKQISEDYKGKELVIIGVMKGAFMFLADLTRRITVAHTVEFLAVSSYGKSTKSSGNVRILMDCREDIAGKVYSSIMSLLIFTLQHVLIVEDIVDTGLTLQYLLELLGSRKPASIQCWYV